MNPESSQPAALAGEVKPRRRPQPKDWQCQECGLRMTAGAAERAMFGDHGCRKCGGSDIDQVAS